MLNFNSFIISKSLSEEQSDFILTKANNLKQLIGCNQNDLNSIYNYYNQSHRHYHNLSHIYNLFKLNDEFLTDYQNIMEVAIWFHDVIYQPFYRNNEARSFDFFIKKLKKSSSNQLLKEDIRWIEAAIMSTSGHAPRIEDDGIRLFLDIDLSILASDWDTYIKYSEGVRKEYWIYPNSIYQKGRKKVLLHFLSQDKIFYTPIFQAKEAIARANINREIRALSK